MSGGPDKPEPTQQERALARQSVEEWNLYTDQYIPLENQLIEDVRNSERYAPEMRGIAATDVGLQAVGQLDNASGQFHGQSGRGLRGLTGMATQQGMAKAGAVTAANEAVRDRELGGMVNMSQFGRGLSGIQSNNLQQTASAAASRSLKNYDFNNNLKQYYGDLAGQAVGFGLGQYKAGGGFGGGSSGPASLPGTSWFDPSSM